MHCCKKPEHRPPNGRWLRAWCGGLAAWLLWASLSTAGAAGFSVTKAEVRAGDEGYRAVADFGVGLNAAVEQALTNGVPLYLVSEFSLVRPRWYWLNETVAHDERTIKLSYNALTRQYRLAYGTLFQNFGSLGDALQVLSHQGFGPVAPSLLKPGTKYVASVRLHLDLTQLAKPLQINALVGSDWILDTQWYRWDVQVGPRDGGNTAWDLAP